MDNFQFPYVATKQILNNLDELESETSKICSQILSEKRVFEVNEWCYWNSIPKMSFQPLISLNYVDPSSKNHENVSNLNSILLPQKSKNIRSGYVILKEHGYEVWL